jgi:hypothetical protein
LNDLIQASFKDCRNNTQIAARAREPPSRNGADLQTAEGSGCKERMPQGDLFEALVVLGSGLGKSRAWHLARTRWQTAVVARRAIDGPSQHRLPAQHEQDLERDRAPGASRRSIRYHDPVASPSMREDPRRPGDMGDPRVR